MNSEASLYPIARHWVRAGLADFYGRGQSSAGEIALRVERETEGQVRWLMERILALEPVMEGEFANRELLDRDLAAAREVRELPMLVEFLCTRVWAGEISEAWEVEFVRGVARVHLQSVRG